MSGSTLVVNNQTQIQDQTEYPAGARSIINIYAKSNESLNLQLKWMKSSGAPFDLSEFSALMTIRDRKDGHVILAQLSTDSGYDGTITLNSVGVISCKMDSSVLETGYKTGSWVYDLVLKSKAGIKTRLVQGSFYIDRSVTYMD